MAGVLITRAAPEAEETASVLRARGHTVVLAPLRRVVSVNAAFPAEPRPLVATSANALRAGPIPASWITGPLYCVGSHTAEAARQAGFQRVINADRDAGALAERILDEMPLGSRLVYLAGEPRGPELESRLSAAGMVVDVLLRYRMVRVAAFPETARRQLTEGTLDTALHFSAESARAFFALADTAGLSIEVRRLRHACLSMAVAEVAQRAAGVPLDLLVAGMPTQDALLATLDSPGPSGLGLEVN